MADHWDQKADDYERRLWSVVGRKGLLAAIRAVEAEDEPGRAGDFGCGTGLFTRHLARRAEHVVALDTSDAMLDSARHKLADLDNIQFLKASCLSTGLPTDSLDTVLMANLLQAVRERDMALAEAARVLRPGGRLIVLAWTASGMKLWNKIAMMWRYLREFGLPPRGSGNVSPEEARALAENNGFDVECCDLLGTQVKCLHLRAKLSGAET
jgi:ubiquinone/menaquinone biosynthesis C-methylase UbiE